MRQIQLLQIPMLVFAAAACRAAEPVSDSAPGAPEIVLGALTHPNFDWETAATEHFQLYAPAGSHAALRIEKLGDEAELARSFVLDRLEERDHADGADLFFVEDREQMRMLVGHPAAGWSVPDESAVFFHHAGDATSPIRHELGHLYSYRLWGEPHGYWLSEGVGMFVVGGCAGEDLHAWAAALQDQGELEPLSELEREFDFSRAAPHLQAGSVVQYVAETHGIEAVKALWREGLAGIESATGQSAEELELTWRHHIERSEFARGVEVAEQVTCE